MTVSTGNVSLDEIIQLKQAQQEAPVSLEEVKGLTEKKTPKGVDEGLLELAGRGLLYGMESTGAGIQELGRAAFTAATGIDVLSDFKEFRNLREADFAAYLARMNALEHRSFWLGGYTGEYGPAVVMPAKTVGQAVTSSALLSAALPTKGDDPSFFSQERTMNALLGASGAAALEPLVQTGRLLVGKLVTDPIKKTAEFFSQAGGKKEALKGVTTAATREATEAAERLGVRITPSEASAKDVLLSREMRALGHLPPEDAIKASELQKIRTQEFANTLNGFINRIVPEGKKAAKAQLTSLYGKAFPTRMSTTFIKKVESNEVYVAAKAALLKDPARRAEFESLPEGSLGQVELVRREISNKAHASAVSIDSIERSKARTLQNINGMLKDVLRSVSPDYGRALPIAQRQISQKRILKELSHIKTEASEIGTSVYNATPIQFYDSILDTPFKRKELKRQLENVGGSGQAIDDLAYVLARIKKTPFKALNVSGDKALQLQSGGWGKVGLAVHNTTAFLRGRHNLALVEVITNGKWQHSLTKVKGIKNPKKQLEALSTMLAYVTTDNISVIKDELNLR